MIKSQKRTKKSAQKEQKEQVMYRPSEKEPLFGLATINDKIRIVCGQNVVSTKEFAHVEEAEEYIASKPYELILNAAVLLFKFTQEQPKEEKK